MAVAEVSQARVANEGKVESTIPQYLAQRFATMNRRVTPRSRGSALGALAAGYLGFILLGSRLIRRRFCPTYLLFGVSCPLCGLTGGCSEALRGHLGQATRRNLAAVPVTAAVLTLTLRWVWEMTR